MDDLGIGQRVKGMRVARAMTQQQLADRLGKSLPWVKGFEAGTIQADPNYSLLRRLGEVLAVPLSALVEDEPIEDSSIDGVRAALLAPSPLTDPGLMDVGRGAAYGHMAFQAGRWQDVVASLPRLIAGARAAVEQCPDDSRALGHLSDVCHLAAITLTKLGDCAGGWAAGDEAVQRAETAADPIGIALAAQSAVYAATAAHRPDIGLGLAHRVIDGVGAQLAALGEEGISALGMVHLKAAYAAAASGDADSAADMIEEGRRAAGRLAPDANFCLTSFNQTNVLVYEASILGDLGRYDRALEVAMRIDPGAFAGLSRERRTHHLVDTARSAQGAGRPDSALRLLLQAERDAPQTVRTWPLSRAVIVALLAGRQPTDGRGLRQLAGRAGVAA